MRHHTGYSAEEAIENLSKYPERFNTPEALQDLVRGMSVDTLGNVTLLYSGMVNADISSNRLALAVARLDKNVRVIDKTEAAKFLASDECISAVANIHGSTPKKVREDYTDPGNKFLFDGKEGLWAITSERFVKDTRTEVVTATPYARGDRVFAQVELREALDNKAVPSINGVPREVFREIYKTTGSLEEVNKAVAASSFDRMQGMQAAVMSARVTAIDIAAFIDSPSPTLSNDQRAKLKPLLDPAKDEQFADGRRLLQDARLKLKSEERKHDFIGAPAKDASFTPAQPVAQRQDADSRHPIANGGHGGLAPYSADSEASRSTLLAAAKVRTSSQQNSTKNSVALIRADGKVNIALLKETYDFTSAEKPGDLAATKSFEGTVLHVDTKHVYQLQDNGRGKRSVIRHDVALYKNPPEVGTKTKVEYLRGTGRVIGREQNLER